MTYLTIQYLVYSSLQMNNALRDVLTGNFDKIAEWAFKWKMQFNPDLNKQAQKIIFSRKTMKPVHSEVQSNESPVACANIQNHLGLFLVSHHIKKNLGKSMKKANVIKKLSNVLPRHSLITIYKSFVRPHLDYGDTDMTNLTMIAFVETLKV